MSHAHRSCDDPASIGTLSASPVPTAASGAHTPKAITNAAPWRCNVARDALRFQDHRRDLCTDAADHAPDQAVEGVHDAGPVLAHGLGHEYGRAFRQAEPCVHQEQPHRKRVRLRVHGSRPSPRVPRACASSAADPWHHASLHARPRDARALNALAGLRISRNREWRRGRSRSRRSAARSTRTTGTPSVRRRTPTA